MTPPAVQTRFTRGRVRELKNGHNSVTVQNRTHVYKNFFHHKGLGNHLLQLCPKVVKHPVYIQKQFCWVSFHAASCSSWQGTCGHILISTLWLHFRSRTQYLCELYVNENCLYNFCYSHVSQETLLVLSHAFSFLEGYVSSKEGQEQQSVSEKWT